jgi:hypothetical protein
MQMVAPRPLFLDITLFTNTTRNVVFFDTLMASLPSLTLRQLQCLRVFRATPLNPPAQGHAMTTFPGLEACGMSDVWCFPTRRRSRAINELHTPVIVISTDKVSGMQLTKSGAVTFAYDRKKSNRDFPEEIRYVPSCLWVQ